MIRVIRVLEYEFDTAELAEWHLGSLQVPFNGVWRPPNGNMTIRSASVMDLNPKEIDEDA